MEKYLGIELGSTRIKAVLTDGTFAPIASGSHDWENRLENGMWTCSLDDVWTGIRDAYSKLAADYEGGYGEPLRRPDGIGISAMMHGYLVFDKDGRQLVPFRTWRNTTTEQAAAKLSEAFRFNIPQRWSAAHLYQAVLNSEPHVGQVAFMTTLAGYVHWALTGHKVLGVGDASGMFPIDSGTNKYDAAMLKQFGAVTGIDLDAILPEVLTAGAPAGLLTADGARLLDPSMTLEPGIPLCPPEGDAGTGMAATNSVTERTGNVSAGTSIFAMLVLEKPLSRPYPEIDMVTTPAGRPVAMAHCNNCTSDLDAWVKIFAQVFEAAGHTISKPELYDLLYGQALDGLPDAGGVLSYNYYAGEPVTGLPEGRPLLVRRPDSTFDLPNFMRGLLYSTMATLALGMDILKAEGVRVDTMLGHGGLFKTPIVGQRLMAAALGAPVSVMETAGEGGAWGAALLAAYGVHSAADKTLTLEQFLAAQVFASMPVRVIHPDADDTQGFALYMEKYRAGLAVEKAAVEHLV